MRGRTSLHTISTNYLYAEQHRSLDRKPDKQPDRNMSLVPQEYALKHFNLSAHELSYAIHSQPQKGHKKARNVEGSRQSSLRLAFLCESSSRPPLRSLFHMHNEGKYLLAPFNLDAVGIRSFRQFSNLQHALAATHIILVQGNRNLTLPG